ncbi:MAG: tetratricopeptide repeat protein [Acidobacteriota bacterium]
MPDTTLLRSSRRCRLALWAACVLSLSLAASSLADPGASQKMTPTVERQELDEDLERWRALIARYRKEGLAGVRDELNQWPPGRVERNARWAETLNERAAAARKLSLPHEPVAPAKAPPEVSAADLAAAAVLFLDGAASEVDAGAYERAPFHLSAGLAYLDLYDRWKTVLDPPLRGLWYRAAASLMLAAVDVDGFEAHLPRIKAAGDVAHLWMIRGAYAELRASPQLEHLLRPRDDRTREGQRVTAARQRSLIEEAERTYRRSVELDPHLVEGWLRLALLLSRQDKPEEAIKALDSIPKASLDVELRYLVLLVSGGARAQAGDWDDAAAEYRAAMQLLPGAQSARIGLSDTLLHDGRAEEAAGLLTKRLAEPPGAAGSDPWWGFQRGPYWRICAVLDALREMVRR